MAEKKTTKKTTSKPAAAKKNTAAKKSTGGAKKTAPAKSRASAQKQPPRREYTDEQAVRYVLNTGRVIAVALFAAAALLLALAFIPGGASPDGGASVWTSMQGVYFGVTGWTGFLLPLILALIGVLLFLNRLRGHVALNLAEGVTLLALLAAMVFAVSRAAADAPTFGEAVKSAYDSQIYGFFGALIGYPLRRIDSGKGPAVIILLILIAADLTALIGPVVSGYLEDTREARAERRRMRSDARIAARDAAARRAEEERERLREERRRRVEQQTGGPGGYYDPRAGQEEKVYRVKPVPSAQDGAKPKKKKPADSKGRTPGVFMDPPEPPVSEPVGGPPPFDPTNVSGNGAAEPAVKEPAPERTEPKEEIPILTPEAQEFTPAQTPVPDAPAAEGEEKGKKKLSEKEITGAAEEIGSAIEENTEDEQDKYAAYQLPGFDLLNMPVRSKRKTSREELYATGEKLIETLKSFSVEASVSAIVPGPSVTRFEVKPAPGVKISKFTNLADDIALRLATPAGVRIEAPIPNKEAIGIEIPNRDRITVTMREALDSDAFRDAKGLLTVALGKDIAGSVICADLARMPHLLVAGTTGSGKSVCLNSMIMSILYRAKPNEVKLILIDPKQVEFSVYNGAPHLLVPVVSDAKKAAGALAWAVSEMLKRYQILNNTGARDIEAYDRLCARDPELEPMCRIVIIIDELSDLMSVAPAEVEGSITRLAQMARAAGMHLVVATQRPSVDVITGLIKANIPSRIALSVSSQIDSRTILDQGGAEKLLGHGDMLFSPVGQSKPTRVQGCFLADSEIERIIDFIKEQTETEYDASVQEELENEAGRISMGGKKTAGEPQAQGELSAADKKLLNEAALCVIRTPDKASVSSLQRRLSMGFAKAGRIMDLLEEAGVVGPSKGSKPRDVLMTESQWLERQANPPSPASASDGENDDNS